MFSEFLKTFGFTNYDLNLMVLCSVCAVIGSLINMFNLELNFSKPPGLGAGERFSFRYLLHEFAGSNTRFYWVVARLFVGASAGLVIAIFFAGSVKPELTSSVKLILLSIFAGYSAPNLWVSQAKIIENKINKHIEDVIEARDREK